MTVHENLKYACGPYRIELFKKGLNRYEKTSYPSRTGIYHEIETEQAVLHFNLNGEIIRLVGKGKNWLHPQEWLKRTIGNDWIYYSTGGYTGVYETTGEYYLPNLPYETNKHMGGNPLADETVSSLIENWPATIKAIAQDIESSGNSIRSVMGNILANTPDILARKGAQLHRISGGPVSVLPPDTRHVDYQVIPLNISSGCLYKCGFCRVKNKSRFTQLGKNEIDSTIDELIDFLADDLINFNAVFLGDHDALQCEAGLILYAMERAHTRLNLDASCVRGSHTFMFGSVSSLLKHDLQFFETIDGLPGRKYINIGLESAHQPTLDALKKPISTTEVERSFDRIQQVNEMCATIEITANFVTDPSLPQAHYDAMLSLVRERLHLPRIKGSIYLSPLQFNDPSRAKLFDFYNLKRLSRLPLYMYTIQRL